jgi:glycosyltransferase involved in cell wall biosynthesis
MNSPKISVITVCYNAEKTIEDTIKSVLGQTYTNIEYIVVDGGSIDGTTKVLQKYNDQLKWISERDKGVYDAMNKGVEIATGDWIYFLGSGDILLDVVDRVAESLNDTRCIYYGDVYFEDLKRIYDGKFPAYKLAVLNISHQAIFYPAGVFKKYRYDLKYKYLADHHLNMLCYGDKAFTFRYLPIMICNYEGNGLSANNPDVAFYEDKPRIIRENFPLWVYLYTRLRANLAKLIKPQTSHGLG